jgi:hypothetical protein
MRGKEALRVNKTWCVEWLEQYGDKLLNKVKRLIEFHPLL